MLQSSRARVLLACALLALPLVLASPAAALTPGYSVRAAAIVDPAGQPFVLRGVEVLDGTFTAPGTAAPGAAALARFARDARTLRALGVNAVRIRVQAARNGAARLRALRRAIGAARAQGLVVVLSTVNSTAARTLPWVAYLARRYHDDPGVWLHPMPDPACRKVDWNRALCEHGWAAWHFEQTRFVRAIRAAGMQSPVLLSLPQRSVDLRPLARYALRDPNIVYGAHRFGGATRELLPAERRLIDRLWAGTPTQRHAVIVDSLAPALGRSRDHVAWTRAYVDLVADWVLNRGGDGAIAIGWRSPAPNALASAAGKLSDWGGLYASRFLALAYGVGSRVRAPGLVRSWLYVDDSGRDVRELQRELAATGYLAPTGLTGSYDYATMQAVMALQGWEGLPRDGIASPALRARLAVAQRPVPHHGGQAHVEVDLERQVLLLVDRGGTVARAIHVSTGAYGKTPAGDFHVLAKATYSYSRPFHVWLPYASYFIGGYALHEYPYVPGYPASHGCVRVPASDATAVYAFAGLGMPVYVA